MTAEELLNSSYSNAVVISDESSDKCVINPETREIYVPEIYQILGVESDEKSERIEFQCPKIVGDNIDLSKLQIRINYENANGEKDQYLVDDVTTQGDNILFSWVLWRKVTLYRGTVRFIVCAVKASNSIVTNEWNTTFAQSEVLEGIEPTSFSPTPEESDIVSQLIEMMQNTQESANRALNAAEKIISGELQQIVPSINNHIITFDYTTLKGE